MDTIIIYMILVFSGLCFGSFAGATVWRIRARSNSDDYNKAETNKLAKLKKRDILHDRSCCLNCSYELRWYDLIPVISWLALRGKCRKCHQPIGWMELLIEISMAAFFLLSYILWPYPLDSWMQIARLAIWLIAGIALAILFVYDLKWTKLPFKVNMFVVVMGALNASIIVFASSNKADSLINILISTLILSGIYWVLYKVSNGKWIGDGDIPLGLGLALLLSDWKLAYIALLVANLIGCLIVLLVMAYQRYFKRDKADDKKLGMSSHIPFGPLLITGSVIAGLAGSYLANLYMAALL